MKFMVACFDYKSGGLFQNIPDRRIDDDTHSRFTAFGLQQRGDIFRGAIAKKLAKRLFVIGNAMLLNQRYEVGRGVSGEGGLAEMRIGGDKVFWEAHQIGKVAAAAAGDEDLVAGALGMFKNGNPASTLPCFNGTHQASGASAEDNCIKFLDHLLTVAEGDGSPDSTMKTALPRTAE